MHSLDDINDYINTMDITTLGKTIVQIDLPILKRPFTLEVLQYYLNIGAIPEIFDDMYLDTLNYKSGLTLTNLCRLERLAYDLIIHEVEKHDDGFNECFVTGEVLQIEQDVILVLKPYYKD